MEGDTSELEIDSELVMSFYDQYQVDDLACKVYCGVEPSKPEAGAGVTLSTSVIELKAPAPAPDVSLICPSSPVTSAGPPGTSTAWNLPDLLVGLDGIQTRCSSDTDSPPLSSQNLLTSTIPCISIPSLDITDNNNSNTTTTNQFYSFDNYRGTTQTDSLLEGLGILSPPPVTSVNTEMVTSSSPQPHYSLVETRTEGE